MKTDPWYLSKRLYAALIMVIVTGASVFGYTVNEEIQANLMELLTALGGFVSIVLVVLSKFKEQKNKAEQ